MSKEEFVEIIKITVEKNSFSDILQDLSNNKIVTDKSRSIIISNWYKSLGNDAQKNIELIISESISNVIFGFFCVLDGVRAIESHPEKGLLQVTYNRNDKTTILNDSESIQLHDIYINTIN